MEKDYNFHGSNKFLYLFCTDRLPGPPQNVRVEPIDAHSVIIRWDPPIKNPHTVEMYRYASTVKC